MQSFVATPPAVAPGADVTLQWKVGGAEKVTVEADGRGQIFEETNPGKIADGSFTEKAPENLPAFGIVRYTLKAHVGTTVTSRALEVYVGAEPRVLDFKVPAFVKEGSDAPVTWRTAFADHVELLVNGVQVYTGPSQDDVDGGTYFLLVC